MRRRNEGTGTIVPDKRVSVLDRGNGEIEIVFRIGGDGPSIIETRVATVL